MRAAILRRGLHPGFGVLHAATDRHDALVWDLMEVFRAPLSEGLVVALFNQGRLDVAMFAEAESGVRIAAEGRKALVIGYETTVGRVLKSPRSGRRRTWRMLMQEEAGAIAEHCRNPEAAPYMPYLLDN